MIQLAPSGYILRLKLDCGGPIKPALTELLNRTFHEPSLKISAGITGEADTLEVVFPDLMEAAIFLATISADPERAAMFKMFWSGE